MVFTRTNNKVTTTGVHEHVVKDMSSSRALNTVSLAFLTCFYPGALLLILSLLSAYTGEIKLSVSYSLNVEETFRFKRLEL